jgi:RHS repeat-associated protein
VTEAPGGTNAQPQLATTLAADVSHVVPGDAVSFTSVVTNAGTLLDLGFWSFSIQNNGSAAFVVKGYQQTLEYFSVSTQAWVPFAKLAYDGDGNPVTITDPTLVPLQWAFVFPNGGSADVTYGQSNPVVGTSIPPGETGVWSFRLSPIIPADVAAVLFNPAEASDLRAATRFDVPSGPPPAPGDASFASALAGVTGAVDSVAVSVHFPAPNTLDPTGTPMSSTDSGPLAPGAARTFTAVVPAPPVLARDPSDTDPGYLTKLAGYELVGYASYASPTGQALTENPFPPNAGLILGLDLPMVTPAKSGPPTSNAGLTQQYTVTLANSGAAAAGPFTIADSVDGATISGTTVNAPASIPAGGNGVATVGAPSPLSRPAGAMTDVVAVTWNDKNGNLYGPESSSFTLSLGAGHPEGYLSITGGTSYPDMTGTPKTLTAVAQDPFGNPAAGLPIQLTITGVNPQTTTLTTGADGKASFTYAGPNLGSDTLVASGTITTTVVQSAPVVVAWASSVGTPCTGRTTPLDLVFVVDGSGSMQGAQLTAAKAATDKLLGQLAAGQDQVGGVVFRGHARLALPLTSDLVQARTVYDAALDELQTECEDCDPGTNIPDALTQALAELTGPRHRTEATPVMVFLSDGGDTTQADPATLHAQVASSGVRSIAIGYGSDYGTDPHGIQIMTALASSQSDYFYAPTAAELEWTYSNLSSDLCRNPVPLVSAGGNQDFYEVRLPDTLTLNGQVHDVNGISGDTRLTTQWTLVSGPGPVTFTDASSPVTQALFAVPGVYVLQLEATDGFLNFADRATVTVDPDPSIVGANLVAALGSPGPLTTGGVETLTATLTDGLGAPISHFVVRMTIAGANAATSLALTDANGVVTFTYQGAKPGTDNLHATALGATLTLDSNVVSVSWIEPATGGPVLTQGWIGAPLHQAVVNQPVSIVLANDVTLESGTVTYWPFSDPTQLHTLVTGTSGSPGAVLATFDPTLLANGPYIIRLDGTDNAGNVKTSEVEVAVSGDYKPGRVVVETTDLTIPIAGLPITVGRRYDSLEKDNVGDFGHGWSLAIGHPRLEVGGDLGVTMTMPDGRRVAFGLELDPPTNELGASFFSNIYQPTYIAEPGVFGTLTSDGCPLVHYDPANPTNLVCFIIGFLSNTYAPSVYTYQDPYGRQFVMGATGELQSIRDRQGNTLTFAPNGIVSSAGNLTVQFLRDGQGRITKVTSPAFDDFGSTIVTDYTYDATTGDLEHVTLPPSEQTAVVHYTYDPTHLLLTTVDPRGHTARKSTYDTAGRLATDTDALGNKTIYTYDLPSKTTTIKNPDNGTVTQVMDDRGLVLSETDPLGRTTTHEYDGNRNETKRTNAIGQVTTTTYDTKGNPTSVTDPLNRTSRTTYDDFSNPTTFKDALLHTTTIAYDDRGSPTSFTDELGTRFSFTSSQQGVPLTVDDAVGNRAYLTYDVAGNVTSRTDWLGRTTKYTYDDIGRKLSETTPGGGVTTHFYRLSGMEYATVDPASAPYGARNFDHDANGNVVTDTRPVSTFISHPTQYFYDDLNHLTLVTYADNTTTQYTWDFRGNKLTETDELGRMTKYDYDLAGQLTKTTFPGGKFTQRFYDDLGRLSSTTDERGFTTSYEYDPGCSCSDRVTKVTDPLGHATRTTYDALGRRTAVIDALGHETDFVTYDVRNQLLETDYPDGTSVHDVYDLRGRRTSTKDQTGAVTLYGYDDQGQLTSVTDALGHVTQYAYDVDGNLTAVTDANNHTTTYEYDHAKRKTRRTLPLGQFETFAYDGVSKQTSHTDFRGKTTSMTYDLRDRMKTKAPDPSLGEPQVTFFYYLNGTRQTMTDASGSTSYTYDVRNRLLTKATPAGTLAYSYDDSGNVATIVSSNANGTSVAYTWDGANQLVSVTDNQAGGASTAAYTPTGRRNTMDLPNGVEMTYVYDVLDRVTSLAWKRGTSSAFQSWAYGYNGRGQRTSATDATGRQVAYGYDAVSRLTSETITSDPRGAIGDGALTYTLDPVGNRLTRASTLAALGPQAFSYDANDEVSTDGYDPNGNTTSFGGHAFAYDFENRLVSKDGETITVVYDGDGARVAKSVGGVTTKYLVDDLNPTGYLQVMEEVSSGAVQTRYTFGSSLVSQTRNVSTTPVTNYYGYDAHGNITFLTDATGAVTDSYNYDAWGSLVASTGTTPNTRLYVGEELDPDLSLINLRARYYASDRGRFSTSDALDILSTSSHKDGSERPIYSASSAPASSGSPGEAPRALPSQGVDNPYVGAVLDVIGVGRPGAAGRLLIPVSQHPYGYANEDPVTLVDPSGLDEVPEYWSTFRILYPRAYKILITAIYGAESGIISPTCAFGLLIKILTCGEQGNLSPGCVTRALRGYLSCRLPGGGPN